jgi:DNA repair exonuclease SbcCD nuclease subunit
METVNAIVIGDPHFQISNIAEAEEFIRKTLLIVQNTTLDFIVVLGDILHTHEKIHVIPFKLACRFMKLLSKYAPTFLIIGNHDYINNQQFLTDNHAFNSLKQWDNITIVDRVRIKYFKGHKFVYCPYVPNNKFEEALNTVLKKEKRWDDATCIFAHQEFYGCQLNPITVSQYGDVWPEEYPLVISGHIHKEQRLQHNIYYPGSCMQHSFADSDPKTIALISFSDKKQFTIQRIDMEMNRKRIVYLEIEKVDNYEPNDNEHIKLVLRGTSEQFKLFRRCDKYKQLTSKGVKIVFVPVKLLEDEFTKPQKQNVLDILQELIREENEYILSAFHKLSQQ